jgi:hypothetical protein
VLDHIKMAGKVTVQDKWCKFKLSIVIRPGRRRGVPELQATTDTDGEESARGRKLERGDTTLEGEVVNDNSAVEIRQNGTTIFVDGQQQVPAGRKVQTVDIGSMRKGKGVGGIAVVA